MGKTSKRKGYAYEREWAQRIGAARVPGSGAIPGHPGDVKDEGQLLRQGTIWSVKARRLTSHDDNTTAIRVLAREMVQLGHDAVAFRFIPSRPAEREALVRAGLDDGAGHADPWFVALPAATLERMAEDLREAHDEIESLRQDLREGGR